MISTGWLGDGHGLIVFSTETENRWAADSETQRKRKRINPMREFESHWYQSNEMKASSKEIKNCETVDES
jgi:hypothetical protein